MSNTPSLDLLVGVPKGSAIVRDYVAGEARAVAFFGAHFAELEAYQAKAREVDGRFDEAARARAAGAMVAPEGADPSRLERLVEDGGYLVTTGQQPGLFGGPLYSVHKALTAVRLAETLEASLGRPVLPLFWIASEDHDWEEANHAYLVGVDNELHRVEVAAPDPGVHPALHRIRLGEDAAEHVSAFVAHLPETDFSREYVDLLADSYREGTTLPEGFQQVLRRLLGRFGLYVTDAADPVVKSESADTLMAELGQSERSERVLSATSAELEAAGYDLQVSILEGGVNLFLEGPAGRERLYREDGAFRLRGSGELVSGAEIRARRDADPAVLSPNVLLRPVVESVVFPTISYVAGPGEIAYFAQLADYFEAFGVRMPVVYPRLGATPVEGKIRKVLDKFGLDLEALQRPFHEVAGEIARDGMPEGVRTALGGLRGAIAKGMGDLQSDTGSIDPTLRGPIEHARGQAFGAIDDLEKKIIHAIKRENEVALTQLEKAQLHLFPLGRAVERIQSPFYYLVRYGEAVLDALYESFPVNLR